MKELFRVLKKIWEEICLPEKNIVEMFGQVSAKVVRANGKVEELGIICRKKVTTAFVNYLIDAMQDSSSNPMDVFKYHDSGTGTTSEANSQTALTTPSGVARETGTQTEGASDNIYKTVATITYDDTYAITEHGIFSATSSGTMADRSVFSAINVNEDDSIQFTYELTANAES